MTKLDGADARGRPVLVDVLVRVASGDDHTSPLSGARGALVHVAVVERRALARADGEAVLVYDDVGEITIGDVLVLEADGVSVTVLARHARLSLAPGAGGAPLERLPPEIAPLVARASGRGVLCWRERVIAHGDSLRLRAVVEAAGAPGRLVARDDLAPVILQETFGPLTG